MPQRCKTCRHPEREKVDIQLARGFSARSLAKQFGLSIEGVSRHRRNGHVPRAILDAFPRQTALSDEGLTQLRRDESANVLLGLARQRRMLLEVQDRAAARKDNQWILKAANALHRNVELVARSIGEFAQHERAISTTNVMNVMLQPDYLKLRQGLLEALRPHPKARMAVARVLQELEGEAPHLDGYAVKQLEALPGWRRRNDQHGERPPAGDRRRPLRPERWLGGAARRLAATGPGGG
jgi:hypothetical protein